MRKIFYITILVFIFIISTQTSYAIELMQTPIQNEFKNSILLASDNWELEEKKEKSSNSVVKVDNKKGNKSAVKAAFYSALLPGLGEHYVGNRTKAKVFFAIEAATWINLIAFHTYGEWKKDDMTRLAADKAGASLEGKSDEYLDWVGFYNSTDQFNTLGRVTDPEREFLAGSENYWQWASDDDRNDFRSYKNSSRTAFNRANFMIVAAISNRIISVIDAVRDAKRSGKKDEAIDISDKKSYNYKFAIDPFSNDRQFTFTVFTPF